MHYKECHWKHGRLPSSHKANSLFVLQKSGYTGRLNARCAWTIDAAGMPRRTFPRPNPHGQPQVALTSHAIRLPPFVRNDNRSRSCPNGWAPFIWVYLGQRAGRPAQGRSQKRNIKHDRRGERQMPDPGRQHRERRAFRPQPNNLRVASGGLPMSRQNVYLRINRL